MKTQVEMAEYLLDARARLAALYATPEAARPDGWEFRAAALEAVGEVLAWALGAGPQQGGSGVGPAAALGRDLEVREAEQQTLARAVTVEPLALLGGSARYALLGFPAFLAGPVPQRPWSAIVPDAHVRQLARALAEYQRRAGEAPTVAFVEGRAR